MGILLKDIKVRIGRRTDKTYLKDSITKTLVPRVGGLLEATD